MKETARHQTAFEAYFALGPKRSLRAVARRLDVSQAAVKKWSQVLLVAATHRRPRGSRRHDRAGTNDERMRWTARRATGKVVQAGIIATARAIAEGTIKPTLSDLDRLIRLEEFLEGRADSRQEIIERDLRSKSTAELRAMLRAEVRELAELGGVVEAEFEVDTPQSDGT